MATINLIPVCDDKTFIIKIQEYSHLVVFHKGKFHNINMKNGSTILTTDSIHEMKNALWRRFKTELHEKLTNKFSKWSAKVNY